MKDYIQVKGNHITHFRSISKVMSLLINKDNSSKLFGVYFGFLINCFVSLISRIQALFLSLRLIIILIPTPM